MKNQILAFFLCFLMVARLLASELSDRAAETLPGHWTAVNIDWHCSNDYSRICTSTGSYNSNTAAHQADCPGADPRAASGNAYCANVFYLFSGAHGMNKRADGNMPVSNYLVTSCPPQMQPAGLMVGSYAPHMWWNRVTRELISFESQHGSGQGGDDIFIYREATNDFKSQFFQPNDDGNHPPGTFHDSEYTWRPTGDYECDAGDYANMTHTYDQMAIGFPAGSTKGRILFNNGSAYVEEWDLDSQAWNLDRTKPSVYPRITPMIWWWPEYSDLLSVFVLVDS